MVLERVGGCGRATRHIELVEDVAEMSRHRLLAETQLVGNGAIRPASGNQPQNLQFARGQPAVDGARAPRGLQALEIQPRARAAESFDARPPARDRRCRCRRAPRHASAINTRARAASYGTSSSRQRAHAVRHAESAAVGSPSASRTAPCASAAIARTKGVASASASVSSSSAARRAPVASPQASQDFHRRAQASASARDDGALPEAPGRSPPTHRRVGSAPDAAVPGPDMATSRIQPLRR